MNTKNFATKTLSLLVACGAVAVCGNPAMSQPPPNSPGATTNMNFAATDVGIECSVTVLPASITTPTPYVIAYTLGGANANILSNDYGTGTPTSLGQEDRAVSMEASDSASFDCNTLTVDVVITGSTVTAPTAGTYPSGLTFQHEVDYTLNSGTPVTAQALAAAGTVTASAQNTDANGDIAVDITSRFTTTGTAEELPAGIYGPTVLAVTVTAL